ncbi:hypothetical protein CJ010_20180 [Azoarcus sp. DD4]|uniref:hypothetical protein n=1 Tax=Azoarcus sp. DD4 TaxID=2027405 RepID=UPI001128F27A|nr:hypothetical protein [Azoarcus sp. DD4]QDF98691.1 hypothetical protein CJ010_20180 [Azoarcus sp. DD4]
MSTGQLTEALIDPRAERAGSRARRTLLLLALVCALPVVASYLAFYFWPPSGRVNHGELLVPAALPTGPLAGIGGQAPLRRAELEGRWTLVYVGSAGCDRACETSLYAMRQARLAQGKEQARVGRLWLLADGGQPRREITSLHPDLRLAPAVDDWLAQLPGAARGVHLYLVDPLGNVMMRFPPVTDGDAAAAEVRGIVKDLQRLLKYSALGRSEGRE